MAVRRMTAEEFHRNYEKHLQELMFGHEIILTRDGKDIVQLLPREKTLALLRASLAKSLKELREKMDREETDKS